ncbi:MAG TPA: MraY family glycosyltransferase [Gemmatimonadaceae bacterium]|nr:MraY family glycosyltransferase [Gemmatimonadaceae bacterium]
MPSALALAVILLASMLSSAVLTAGTIRVAIARGLYDPPTGGRHVHTRPVPRLGGVAICGALFFALAVVMLNLDALDVALEHPRLLRGLLIGGAIIFLTGLIDDLWGLKAWAKLAIQVVAAICVCYFGFRIAAISLSGKAPIALGILSIPLSIAWIVVMTNAYNLVDGIDGLATGIGLLALCLSMWVAATTRHPDVVIVCIVLVGALLGFFPYNMSPARIFLGDSGSLLVGFMLPVLVVGAAAEPDASVPVLIPLSLLALPLADTTFAILRRWLRQRPIFRPDKRHLHHQLLSRGWSHGRATTCLCALAAVLAMPAVVTELAPASIRAPVSLGAGLLVGLVLVYAAQQLGYHEFSVATTILASVPGDTRRTISARIHALDLAEVLRSAKTVGQLNAILADNLAALGLASACVCRASEWRMGQNMLADVPTSRMRGAGHLAHYVRLRHRHTLALGAERDDYLLMVWSADGDRRAPHAAHVISVLASAVEDWLSRTSERGVVAGWAARMPDDIVVRSPRRSRALSDGRRQSDARRSLPINLSRDGGDAAMRLE